MSRMSSQDTMTAPPLTEYEGVSDPDDMVVVYGIEGRHGLKATVVDAFGVYSDPALGAVLERIAILGK